MSSATFATRSVSKPSARSTHRDKKVSRAGFFCTNTLSYAPLAINRNVSKTSWGEVGTNVAPVFLKRSLQIQFGKTGQITSFPAIRASAVAVDPNDTNASQILVSSRISDFCETNIIFLF